MYFLIIGTLRPIQWYYWIPFNFFKKGANNYPCLFSCTTKLLNLHAVFENSQLRHRIANIDIVDMGSTYVHTQAMYIDPLVPSVTPVRSTPRVFGIVTERRLESPLLRLDFIRAATSCRNFVPQLRALQLLVHFLLTRSWRSRKESPFSKTLNLFVHTSYIL